MATSCTIQNVVVTPTVGFLFSWSKSWLIYISRTMKTKHSSVKSHSTEPIQPVWWNEIKIIRRQVECNGTSSMRNWDISCFSLNMTSLRVISYNKHVHEHVTKSRLCNEHFSDAQFPDKFLIPKTVKLLKSTTILLIYSVHCWESSRQTRTALLLAFLL